MLKYPAVVQKDGRLSVGGSQMWIEDKRLQSSACGVVAGCDIVLKKQGIDTIDRKDYMQRIAEAAGYIKPVNLPFKVKPVKTKLGIFRGSFGVPFGRFKRGVRALAAKYNIDVRVKRFGFKKLPGYLSEGYPVTLLIHAPFGNVRLIPQDDGRKTEKVGFHWVTVLGQTDEALQVSSWGRLYYIPTADLKKFTVGTVFCAVV